ncbi:MAG: hypothetical protein CXR31_10100 [Geobacter sp.]|nr:MAG: hypothetical protein CXR31_10100 [Geobacter sp.]
MKERHNPIDIAAQIEADIRRLTGKDINVDTRFEVAEPTDFFETCLYFDLLGYHIYTKSYYAHKVGLSRQAIDQKIRYNNLTAIKCRSEKLNKLELVAVREEA